jgi:tryptophan synthase beta subunit
MLCLALRDIEGGPHGCLSRDTAATLTGGRRTYLIGLITGLVRPSWATVLRRGALRAARDCRSAGNEQADAQKRQGQHSM